MARTKKVDKKEKKADKNVSKTSKASKKPEKTGEKEVVKKTKRKPESYGRYLYKVLKQIHENTGISQRAMIILNDFMNDIFERIANEASVLANRDKSRTLRSRDVMTAVKLVFVGELGKHAVAEATNALEKYKLSYGKDKKEKSKRTAHQNVVRREEENEEDEEDEEDEEENEDEDDGEENEEDESEEE